MNRRGLISGLVGLIILIAAVVVLGGCEHKDSGREQKKELTIFHAGSLSVPFREISELFKNTHPDIVVRTEASGSRDCVRKICDLGRNCDVIASADYKVIENLLMPDFAAFNIRFAINEMAIAYTSESGLSDTVTAQNWHKILLKDNVIFGRSDPNRDPCGYRTLMVFQLAEKYYGIEGLAEKLIQKGKGRYLRPKETDLLALLESGEIDYLFIYRSVASQHGLKTVLLPEEINLKNASLRELYNTAAVKVTGKRPGEFITRRGEPMVYSITIPENAENPESAKEWIKFLLSPQGRAVMERNGQRCLSPAVVDGFDKLPESLKPFCKPN